MKKYDNLFRLRQSKSKLTSNPLIMSDELFKYTIMNRLEDSICINGLKSVQCICLSRIRIGLFLDNDNLEVARGIGARSQSNFGQCRM